MALPAEFPFIGFCRRYDPGFRFMLFRRFVADSARQQCMIGSHLGPLDLRMTGSAGARNMERFRVMRIMARYTGFARIMGIRVDLGEAGRP